MLLGWKEGRNLDRTLIVRLVIAWGFLMFEHALCLLHSKRSPLPSSSSLILISKLCRISAGFDCQRRTVAFSLASARLGDAFDSFGPSRVLQEGLTQKMIPALFLSLHLLYSYRTYMKDRPISNGPALHVPSDVSAERVATRSESYALSRYQTLPGALGLFHLALSSFVQ